MARNIDSTAQLSFFETIRDIIAANSVIKTKFKKSDFYKWEENLKSRSVNLPYIVIKYPTTNTDLLVLSQEQTIKNYEFSIILKMAWEARDKFEDYANAIISSLEAGEDTLATAGLHNPTIDLEEPEDEVEDQKQLIVGQFTLTVDVGVAR